MRVGTAQAVSLASAERAIYGSHTVDLATDLVYERIARRAEKVWTQRAIEMREIAVTKVTAETALADGLADAIKKSMRACGCKRLVPPVPTGCPPCDLLTAALAAYQKARGT